MLAHERDAPAQPLELLGVDERLRPARARRLVQRARDRRIVDAGDLRRPGAPLVEHELIVGHALDDLDALGAGVPLVRLDLAHAIGSDVDQPIGARSPSRCAPRSPRHARSLRCSASTTTMSSASRTTLASLSCAVPPPDSRSSGSPLPPPARHAIGIAGEDRLPQRHVRVLDAGRAADARRAARAAAARDRSSAPRRRRARASARRSGCSPPRAASAKRSRSASRSESPLSSARRGRCHTRSRSPTSAATTQPSRPTPRASASTTSRACRGCSGKRSIRRPSGVDADRARRSRRAAARARAPRRPPAAGGASSHASSSTRTPEDAKQEQRIGQIEAPDLGRILQRTRVVIVLRVQPQAAPGPQASRAPRALRRRGARDPLHLERRHARPRRERRHARQPAVDDRDHALDGDRRLGDVRRQDHLAPRTRRDGTILLFGPQVAVQHDDVDAGRRGDARARRLRLADLRGARQEHQHVAVETVGDELAQRLRHVALERPSPQPPPRAAHIRLSRRTAAPRRAATGSPRKPATGSASSVADITTSFRSVRRACRRRSSASATSPCRCRS